MYYTYLARRKSLAIWVGLQTSLASFVYYRYRTPKSLTDSSLSSRLEQLKAVPMTH
ncbi:uncharacterized protein EV420DRAFT_1518148 [Desarmillaria tabescens]|uniref:Uncharacterized protein n=1 Tax=Armillaria tabescens TaxID=1929756 RepID=A0AA39MKL1_ARMTA|nr:uncharacterized protein EV420DRAFT_1589028 [Desarmillaria tabescens]XP_060335901.1 uncharacterized protein EV420DRAFT_1518148 [Desarmillaria tabescens]KAK0437149.1 hypothetical protein EV420DRAFT_1589028 [Desarmillaria tabescens]KAK0464780.1 hypothetical protein EV420DRAFT_1518148 [Desarmillaria tabescens]